MDPENLRDQLNKLHEELHSTRPDDPHTDRLRGEVLEDLKRALQAPGEVDESFAERLERAAV
jgi:hypothetical protein